MEILLELEPLSLKQLNQNQYFFTKGQHRFKMLKYARNAMHTEYSWHIKMLFQVDINTYINEPTIKRASNNTDPVLSTLLRMRFSFIIYRLTITIKTVGAALSDASYDTFQHNRIAINSI